MQRNAKTASESGGAPAVKSRRQDPSRPPSGEDARLPQQRDRDLPGGPTAQPEIPEPHPGLGPPPETLRAFVRLLAREAARELLEGGTAADPAPPTETTAPPAKPVADTNL